MKVLCCLLVDEVTTQPFKVSGYVDQIASASPSFTQVLKLAVVLQVEPADYGTSPDLRFRVINADGKAILDTTEKALQIKFPEVQSRPLPTVYGSFAIPVKFREFGDYSVEIAVGGQVIRTLPLLVKALG